MIIPLLLAVRYPYYKRRKWHYFMLDFCYATHLFCMCQLYVFPQSCMGLKVSKQYSSNIICDILRCFLRDFVSISNTVLLYYIQIFMDSNHAVCMGSTDS